MSERFKTSQRGLAPGTVCAVLVHYRQPEAVRECLYALHELATDLPVVVVENGSRDRSVIALRMLAAEHPSVHLVEEKFCHGFSAGANQGVEAALELVPRLEPMLPEGSRLQPWKDLNRGLFFALRLERMLMFVAVFLIVPVA